MTAATKPPLGIEPERIHNQDRAIEIIAAIKRYAEAGSLPPIEWLEEIRYLIESL